MPDRNPNRDDLIGQTIAGRYRIISRLGAGGMGTAYRAWDEQAGVPVVIKIPKKVFLEDPKFAERFRREIRLLQGLTHPHIVPITDVGDHEGLPFVVLRFLPGGSLSNRRLRDENSRVRPNPPGMLHLWLPAVAEALDFVHSQGVVHRDVKPANIFFDAFWGAYLGDFGIAKIVEESEAFDKEHTLTATHMGIGTQDYMCPEQFTPKAVIDGRADQYALAVMVYEMVAATRPFTGATAHLIVEVTTQRVPPLQTHRRDLPPSLVDAVHRGLAKRPEERFVTCREFVEAVLRDVQPLDSELALARLLCPNPKCSSILKLPTSAAGRRGKCPKCQLEMKVADDLGALWLLDEARRQKRAGSDGERTEEAVGVILADEGGLDSFKPVSSTTPIERAVGKRRQPAPLMILGGLGAAALAAGVLVFVFGGGGSGRSVPKKPPAVEQHATYEEQLAAAEARLTNSPVDQAANEIVGSHWCFREQAWDKGLSYLVKGKTQELVSAAKKEIQARNTSPIDPGEVIKAAKGWWQVAVKQGVLTKDAADAIRKHAADIYGEQVGSLKTEGDMAFVNKWLDEDSVFRDLVGNKRPLNASVPLQVKQPADAVVWEKNGHSYKVFKQTLSWPQAKQRCEELGGHLVTITSPEEQQFVLSLISKAGISVDKRQQGLESWHDKLWAGGTDDGSEGNWRWVDGSPWDFAKWLNGAPQQDGNFLDICPHKDGCWNDGGAQDYFIVGFICEWPRGAVVAREESSQTRRNGTETASATEILALPPIRNFIGIELKLIPAGTFQMGSDGEANEKPVHEVRITKPFYLGVTEVTNAQWKRVMGNVPSKWKDDNRPVEQVGWDDVVQFCAKLSSLPEEKKSRRVYRLPTEAEWEYACRAGTTTAYSYGDNPNALNDFGWFRATSNRETHAVASRKPNPWGLYDMHGNVWEWCSDGYGNYEKVPVTDPLVPARPECVVRGGGFWETRGGCRSTVRLPRPQTSRQDNLGFRLALSPSGASSPEASGTSAADPGALSRHQASVGQTLCFNVLGSATSGPIWGSNPYTADSRLSRAAVHAGVLRPGESGVVRVTVLPGQQAYEGSTQNGVTSWRYGPWSLSYRIERERQKETAAVPDPVVGRWRWFVNSGEFPGHEFLPNGIVKDTPDASWLLVDPKTKRYQFLWGNGKFIDVMTLSPDGKTLEGKNNEGTPIAGNRID